MALSASQIASYGADTVDYTSATTVAQALGISPKQVTGDFNTVTTWVADGTYMVIAVGGQAAMALYWNPCGWSTTAFSESGDTTTTLLPFPIRRLALPVVLAKQTKKNPDLYSVKDGVRVFLSYRV